MDFQRQENFATSLNPHIEVVQHIVPFSNFIESQPISISADSIIPSFTLHAQKSARNLASASISPQLKKLKYQIRKCQQLPIILPYDLTLNLISSKKCIISFFVDLLLSILPKMNFALINLYYPNVNIPIKETKILPYKYFSNEVFDNIRSGNQNNHQWLSYA